MNADTVTTRANAAATPGALITPAIPEAAARPAIRSAGRNATIIGLAFILSRVLGLVREVILGYRFGTTSEYDAYVSAFRIPDLLFLVVMAGAFGAAFIPVFAGFMARDEEHKAWRLASSILTLSAVAMVVLSLVMAVFAHPLIRYVVAPDLPPEYITLSVATMRILLVSQILLGLGIASKGILEAQSQFTLPAFAPVVYNFAIILGAIFLAPHWGVKGVAVGVVFGALFHVLIQVPGLLNCGLEFVPSLSTQVEGLGEVGRLLLPRVIGLAAFQLNFVAVTHLASGAGEGRVSALNYAWQMMMLPHGVIALSISTVIFPAMARLYQEGDAAGVRTTFTSALMPLLFLTVPASIGLYEFRVVIPQTVFELGAFNAQSTALVAPALQFLALGLVWYALVEVLARIYYAMQDTVTPVAAGIAIIVINIVLGALLVDSMGSTGLALALTASTAIEALILSWLLRRRIGGLGPEFGSWVARLMLAAAAMALMAELVRPKLERATAPGTGHRIVHLLLLGYATALVAGTYFVAGYLLRLPEVTRGLAMAHRRLAPFVRMVAAK